MRPLRPTLLLLLLTHAAGIAWADRGGDLPAPAVLLAGGVIGLAGSALGRRGGFVVLAVLSVCLGHQALARELARARADAVLVERLDPKAIRLVDARVAARRATGFGEEVELVDVRSRPGDARVPERLLLAIPAGASRAERLFWPGSRVRIGVSVSPLRPPRNPGQPDRAHALARQGLAARARLVKADWVVERVPLGDPGARVGMALARMRRDVGERVGDRLARLGGGEGDAAGSGLVRALAVGDRRGLSGETRRSFRQLGLAHLISVSGLHIGFVALPAAGWMLRARTLGRPRSRPVLGFGAPVAAGCLAAGSYAWLTGAGVPALRASLLFALFGITRAFGLSIPPSTALAGIALVVLLASPAQLFDAGALFSFAACAALIAGGVWGTPAHPTAPDAESAVEGPSGIDLRSVRVAVIRRVLRLSGESLRASLAVSIGMLPLVELYGLPRSMPSPLVNALAIPWAGLVVLPCSLAASALACLLPVGVGDGLLALLLLPAAGLEQAAHWTAAQLPRVWIGEDVPGRLAWPWALVIGGVAFARLRRGRSGLASAAWMLLALVGIEPLGERAFEGPLPRVVFFDVGQADAALVQARDSAWLIDSGSGPEDGSGGTALLRALRAQGVDRLDVLAVTHGDLDHRGGALRVLSAVNVRELWLPALAARDPALSDLAAAATANGVRVRWVAAGDRAGSTDSISAEVLWPPAPSVGATGGAWAARSRNDVSLVLRIEAGGRRFLFAADIGADVEGRLVEGERPLRAEVLKVAHHGSRQSSSARFLAAVAPRVAVVSAPCGAGRGLPSGPALERLRAAGAELGWTGRDGAIAVSTGSSGASAEAIPGGGSRAGGDEGAAPLQMRYWGGERRCVPELRRADARRRGEP